MNPREGDTGVPEDDHALAAEFVLGLVQGPVRAALQRRIGEDAAFARNVRFWEARLAPLAEQIPPVDVAPHVWTNIQAELASPEMGRSAVAVVVPRPGLWNSLAFWRWFGLGMSGLAAACLAMLLLSPGAHPPSLVASLTMANGSSAFMATVDRAAGRVMLMPAADMPAPAERQYQLWIVPPDGEPVSLGTISAARPVTIDMPSAVMPHAAPQSALVVSEEPMGGSPTGRPTGPVVARGMMHDI